MRMPHVHMMPWQATALPLRAVLRHTSSLPQKVSYFLPHALHTPLKSLVQLLECLTLLQVVKERIPVSHW